MYGTIAFIGPLPPPHGGVAAMNQSFQSLNLDPFTIISFDTSKKRKRERLYGNFPWKSILKEIKRNQELIHFLNKTEPDVVNIFATSGYSIFRDILFLISIKRFNIPTIVHFHSKFHGEFALKHRRLTLLGKIFNRFADRIVLLSDEHLQYFKKFFPEKKSTVIENFVDYSMFNNVIENKEDKFLFVGRLSKEKGFFDLLEACKIVKKEKPNFILDVIGVSPEEEIEQEVVKFLKENELSDNVILHGSKFHNEKIFFFKRNKILVFPSHFENSPVVLKEAIAAKMAIIASDIEANKRILGSERNNLLSKKGCHKGIAESMLKLISQPWLAKEMCRSSSEIKKYDKEIARHLFKDLILQLMKEDAQGCKIS